jgi:periplasmic divalent cation tolerance protein
MKTLMVYVTCKDEEEARKISLDLLEKRLVACANMCPIRSLYWWKGNIEDDSEELLIMKTQEKHIDLIIKTIKDIHSYDVPCIEFIEINSGNPDYLDWILKETKDG